MAFFLFTKNSDNLESTFYRFYENQFDLNDSNINKESYKIIEDSSDNFNSVKYGTKRVVKYNNDTIIFENITTSFNDKESLKKDIDLFKKRIKEFTENNPSHPLYNRWNNYYNQLNSLNLDSISYPLNMSLEKYFNNLGQTSLSPLQLP